MNARTTLIAIVGAATMFGGCACAPSDLAGLPINADEPIAATVAPTTTDASVEPKIEPTYWLYGRDDTEPCESITGTGTIPCRDVVHVCVTYDDGYRESKWFPSIYAPCGPDAPTWRTVCLDRPQAEWAWYGYTDEKCAGT